jgi:hypothetical protein
MLPGRKRGTYIIDDSFNKRYDSLEKKEILSERIHASSLMSDVTGAIPVPFMDNAVDIGILIEETTFYKTQFGLSEEMLEAYAQRSEMTVDQLTSNFNLQSRFIGLSAKGILSYLSKKGFKKASRLTTEEYIKVRSASVWKYVEWSCFVCDDVMVSSRLTELYGRGCIENK